MLIIISYTFKSLYRFDKKHKYDFNISNYSLFCNWVKTQEEKHLAWENGVEEKNTDKRWIAQLFLVLLSNKMEKHLDYCVNINSQKGFGLLTFF